jgi:hypothetical protein
MKCSKVTKQAVVGKDVLSLSCHLSPSRSAVDRHNVLQRVVVPSHLANSVAETRLALNRSARNPARP